MTSQRADAGYSESGHWMRKPALKGTEGDVRQAVLFAAGFDICWLLTMIRKKVPAFFPHQTAGFERVSEEKFVIQIRWVIRSRLTGACDRALVL